MTERTIDRHGAPVQQSMTARPQDYTSLNISRMMLGVVLSVFPSDNEANRSSFQRADRRGYVHTCNVLVIQDGRGTHVTLENVVIPPGHPSGLDNFSESLPRGCSGLVTGENWNSQFNHISPYDLDGDWCVVGFIGGSIDQPFIVCWWPHPHNACDPATSGNSNPADPSSGQTLEQSGRVFRRVNGVESVITKEGNVYLSTHRANSTLRFGNDLSPVEGRFPRNLQTSEGGSIRVWVKESQSMELDFNPPVDGMGVLDVADAGIPQTNPRSSSSSASRESKDNTYILVEKDRIHITVPDEFKLHSKRRILLSSDGDTTLTVGGSLSIDATGDAALATDGNLDLSAIEEMAITSFGPMTITGDTTLEVQAGATTINSNATLALSSTAALSVTGATVSVGAAGAAPGTPGSLSVTPTGLTLGSGALGGAVGGTALQAAAAAFAAQVLAAQGSATVEAAYAAQITAAAAAFASAIAAAISSTTRVG